jgi:hypothetical protein
MYNAQADLDASLTLLGLVVIFFLFAGILSFIMAHLGED